MLSVHCEECLKSWEDSGEDIGSFPIDCGQDIVTCPWQHNIERRRLTISVKVEILEATIERTKNAGNVGKIIDDMFSPTVKWFRHA